MISLRYCVFSCCLAAGLFLPLQEIQSAESKTDNGWRLLFNGTNLDGWYIVLRNGRNDDPDHLVQIHDGAVHMYKDAPADSPQPHGYIVTDKEYSNYHLRLEYKWGTKRFGGRAKSRRDAGILYHVVGKDGVWPRSVECQIQEEDVGDIFTVNTRVTALADPKTTNLVTNVTTNETGQVRTNQMMQPHFLPAEKGGVPVIQGVAGGIRRVIRSPMNEHDGWNTVEIIVHGDSATHIVNGKTNNQANDIREMVNNQWVPLKKGKITLQLESAEILYRNVQIKELKE
jgi:hypothetical protein